MNVVYFGISGLLHPSSSLHELTLELTTKPSGGAAAVRDNQFVLMDGCVGLVSGAARARLRAVMQTN